MELSVVNAFAFEMLVGVGLTDLQAALGNIVICVMAVVSTVSALSPCLIHFISASAVLGVLFLTTNQIFR